MSSSSPISITFTPGTLWVYWTVGSTDPNLKWHHPWGRPGVPHLMTNFDFQSGSRMGPRRAWRQEPVILGLCCIKAIGWGPRWGPLLMGPGPHGSTMGLPSSYRIWLKIRWPMGPHKPQSSISPNTTGFWVFIDPVLAVKSWGIQEPITPLEVYASTNQNLQ